MSTHNGFQLSRTFVLSIVRFDSVINDLRFTYIIIPRWYTPALELGRLSSYNSNCNNQFPARGILVEC